MKTNKEDLDLLNRKIWKYRNSEGDTFDLFISYLSILLIFASIGIYYAVFNVNDESDVATKLIGIYLALAVISFIIFQPLRLRIKKEREKTYYEYHELCKNLAESLKLEYQTNKPKGESSSLQFILKEYSRFHIFFTNGYIYEMMEGKLGIYQIKVMDYSYWTYKNKEKIFHNWTLLQVDFDFSVFPLVIFPKSSYSKEVPIRNGIKKLKSFKFEFDDFNQAFNVYGKDKRFSFDIINPEMMGYLLHTQKQRIQIALIEIHKHSLIFVHKGFLYKSLIPSLLDCAQGFLEKIPGYILDSKQ